MFILGRPHASQSERNTSVFNLRTHQKKVMAKFCMRTASLLLIICLLLPAFPVFAAEVPDDPETVYTLPVFETSDIHGYLADTSSSSYEYRLAYISDKVRDARTKDDVYRKDNALLLDGGDIFQGNTLSNLLKGSSLSAAFMLMDYDAVALGNHEFDWDVFTVVDSDGTMLDSYLDETPMVNDIPVLTSNLYYKREKVPFAREYIIVEKTATDGNGNTVPVRIGVVGFTEDHAGSIMNTRFTGAGFVTIVDYSNANRIAAELESSGQCDATVLLTHAAAEDAAFNLGQGTAFDLVLGGHTHASVVGRTGWGLTYMQPAAYSTAFAAAEFEFRIQDGKPVLSQVSNARTVGVTDAPSRLYPTPENASDLDPAVVSLTDRVIEEISELLEARVGYITTPAKKSDYLPGSDRRSSTMGNWMASIIARAVGAEVGFVNGGGIRTDMTMNADNRWQRTITVSDIYTMFPFNNLLYCYELTYQELLELMTYALTESGGSLLSCMTGIECYFVGGTVQALVRDGKAVYLDGQWAPGWAERKIRVGVSEFVATSNRMAGSMPNPLVSWANTSRLVSNDLVDVEGVFKVLDEESENNHWELAIDKTPYFVSGRFFGPMWQEGDPVPNAPGAQESGAEDPSAAPLQSASVTESSELPSESGPDRQAPADSGSSLLKNPLSPVVLVLVIVIVVILVRTFAGRKDKEDVPPEDRW